jgi:O-antigen/teichoic acid export membrane protein
MTLPASSEVGATRQRIRRVFSIGLLNNVMSLLISFLIPPLFVSALGTERYGQWLYLFSIPTSLVMLDMGISSAFSTEIYRHHVEGRVEQAARLLRTGCRVVVALMLLVLVLSASLIAWHHATQGDLEFHATLFVLCLYIILGFPSELLVASFKIAGRFDQNQWLYLAARILELVLLLALIRTNQFVWMAGGLVAARVLMMLALAVQARRLTPTLFRGHWRDREPFKHLWLPSVTHALSPLIIFVSMQVPLLILAPTAGLTAVVAYSTIRTLARLPLQLSSQMSYSLFTEYTRMAANGQHGLIERLYRKGQWAIIGLFSLAAVGGWWLGEPFLNWWVKQTVIGFHWIFVCLVLEALFESMMRHRVCLSSSNNRHAFDAMFQLMVVGFAVCGLYITGQSTGELVWMVMASAGVTLSGLLILLWRDRRLDLSQMLGSGAR